MKEYARCDDTFKMEILNEFKLGFTISHPALPQDVDLFEENGRLYRVSAYREAFWLESVLAEHGQFEIYAIRECGFQPYVMLYDKAHIPRGSVYGRLQRWCNNPRIFWKCERFEDYSRKDFG